MKKSIFKTVLFAGAMSLALPLSAATIGTNNPTGNSATNAQNPSNTTTTPGVGSTANPSGASSNRISTSGDTLNTSRNSTVTSPPLSTTPPGTLPMAIPQAVDPANRANDTIDQSQRRAQGQPFQGAETCSDTDAACLRRRSEQLRRNTPFEYRTPPAPGAATNPDGSLRQ